jgi:hypothetical protein
MTESFDRLHHDKPPCRSRKAAISTGYTERTWVFRKAWCVPRASGQGAPTRRSGHDGEKAQRRPRVRGACNAAKNPRALGMSPTCDLRTGIERLDDRLGDRGIRHNIQGDVRWRKFEATLS